MDATFIDALVATPSVGLAIMIWNHINFRNDSKATLDLLSEKEKEARARADEIADKAITALTEVNIYLADTAKHLEAVGGVVTQEHGITRDHVTATINSISGDGKA